MERKELKNCPRLILPEFDGLDTLQKIKDINELYRELSCLQDLEHWMTVVDHALLEDKCIRLNAQLGREVRKIADSWFSKNLALCNLIEFPGGRRCEMNRKFPEYPRLILPRYDDYDALKDVQTACDLERVLVILRSLVFYNKDIQLDAIIEQLQSLLADTLNDFVYALVDTDDVDELIEHPRKGGAE